MSSCATRYQVVELNPSDLDEIIEIENTSFKSPWPIEIFEMEFKNKRSYNLVCKNEDCLVIGYCLSWIIYDEIHILKIAVHNDYRNNGIGTMLMNKTVDYFKSQGANHAVLEVRIDNDSAINMYEKLGFKPLRIRRNYYKETGEDALVMLLDLDS